MATIKGTNARDVLKGRAGKDLIAGFDGNDDLYGRSGDDTLIGGNGNDKLLGELGNDLLLGGEGADKLDGGAGIDWALYADGAKSGVKVSLLTRKGSGGHATSDTLSNIENVQGTKFNDTLTGAANGNFLDGGSGNDTLNGGAGSDTLLGAKGADRLDGGAGTDWALYESGATAGVTINLETHVGSGGTATGDRLFNIENVQGTKFNDTLTGDANANVLNGGVGGDTLNGGGGNDTLSGGAGADMLDGGAGTGDIAFYSDSAAGVSINLFTHAAGTGGTAQGDILSNIENILGSIHSDELVGDGAANLLFGGAGNDILRDGDTVTTTDVDTFRPGAGSDTITGDGNDILDYRDSTSGVVLDLAANTAGGFAAGDTYSGIAEAYGGGSADQLSSGTSIGASLYGFGGNDTLTLVGLFQQAVGGDGADTIVLKGSNQTAFGEAGIDTLDATLATGQATLRGGIGNDILKGGATAQSDFLVGGAGADTLDGGAGTTDWAYYNDGTTVGVTVDISTATGTASDGDTLVNIENILGSGFNDTITGSSGINTLQGGAGDDTLNAGGGGTLGGAADLLDGGAGNDTLNAGASIDCNLSGGVGNDSLTGNASARDVFFIERLTGTDTITNFLRGNGDLLRIDRSDFNFGGVFDSAELVNSAGVVASGTNSQLIYDQNAQQLWYDSDGEGTTAATQLATLTGGPGSLLITDFLVIA